MNDENVDISANTNISVIGFGFVGKATALGFLQVGGFNVCVVDPYVEVSDITVKHSHMKKMCATNSDKSYLYQHTLTTAVKNSKVIFICVPTPMFDDGASDTSIVENVCKEINEILLRENKNSLVVIKSTVSPGTCQKIQNECNNISVVFNPEFLKEATFLKDFLEQNRIILGSKDNRALNKVFSIYSEFLKNRHEYFYEAFLLSGSSDDKERYLTAQHTPIKTFDDYESAEMVKYVANCFLATKISFANEMYQVCQKLNVNYDNVIEAATLDERLGPKYGWTVPGEIKYNGKAVFGYGLSCFPKDVNAFIHKAKELGVDPKVVKACWEKNLEVRGKENRDWEKMSKAFTQKKEEK